MNYILYSSPYGTGIKKLLLIMKFAIVLICFSTGMLWANDAYSQSAKITMQLKNVTVREVFHEIESNSEFIFIFRDDALNLDRKVSLDVKDKTINYILDELFKRTDNRYEIIDRQVVILTKEINRINSDKVGSVQEGITITGTITDVSGEPMPGVNIVVDGTTIGTVTDANGKYRFYVPSKNVTLIVSFVGYKKMEIPVEGRTEISVIMVEDTEALEEVVVVGYGKQKKSSVVSSINSISNKELTMPTRNLTNNLAGQISGLIAIQRSGEPGYDNSEFWIRGISSFKGGTTPLVLVDGIPRNMNDIEPDEIESFSLLKDAAATAVYGAEGANGVILVTSKRGTVQKAKISFRAEASTLTPTRLPEFVSSAEFLSIYNEGLQNEGKESIYSDELIAKYASGEDPDLYPNSQWLDLLKKHTWNDRFTINVRGGTEKARYFVSGAYFQESGIFETNALAKYDNNIGLKRYNLRSNIDMDVTKSTVLGIDLSGQYLQTNYPGVGTAKIFRDMTSTPPHLFPFVYSDGTIAGHPNPSDNRVNPYNQLMNSGYSQEWRTSIQSKITLQQGLDFITKGLSLRGIISYDANMTYSTSRKMTPTQSFATGRDETGNLLFNTVVNGSTNLAETNSNSGNKQIYIESSFNYNRIFAEKHTVHAMALYMQKDYQTHNNSLPFRKQGVVGRVTYSYDNRYFAEGNFGYTGSETFAKGHRFGFFPAMGLAWYLSEEKFYPTTLKKYLSKMKLRYSIGRTGNDNTGGSRFMYRETLNQGAAAYNIGFTTGGSGATGGVGNSIVEAQFSAPYLSWEIEEKNNYGIDIGLFQGRVDIQFDYFHNERYNILLQRQTVSGVAGFQQAPWQNYGSVINKGFDAGVTINQSIGNFRLSARGNFTFARNKIEQQDEIPQIYDWMNSTGTRLNSWNLYLADGLYTNDDFTITETNGVKTYTLKEGMALSTLGGSILPGDIKYKDLNNDGTINSLDRVQDVGNPSIPEIVYGFGFNIEYKGLYAGIFFQGAANTSTVLGANTAEGFFPFHWGIDESNLRTTVSNRWTEENPSQNVLYPRIRSSRHENNSAASTWWQRSAAFLRLKNIEAGYNLPKSFTQKFRCEAARIYFMGYNVAVWDQIKMWDPEMGNANAGLNYPLSRTFTLGVELTF